MGGGRVRGGGREMMKVTRSESVDRKSRRKRDEIEVERTGWGSTRGGSTEGEAKLNKVNK